jgi:hypothetical protein
VDKEVVEEGIGGGMGEIGNLVVRMKLHPLCSFLQLDFPGHF